MEDGIGKMQIALGVVAYCSFILFIQSYGLELLDLEEKVKLVWIFFFINYKLQSNLAVRNVMVPVF